MVAQGPNGTPSQGFGQGLTFPDTRTAVEEAPTSAAPKVLYAFAVCGVLGLAAWLRLTGVTFGLPAVYNPDEISIVSRALAFAKGDLNPHNFVYPTFFFYVLFGWLGVYYVLARVVGDVSSVAAFETQFFVDPSGVYLAARTLGVVCGVAGVLATWWLARRLFGRSVALAAALFMAVAPTAVRDAHYVKHDVPVTLAVTLSMIAMSAVWPLGRRRWEQFTGAIGPAKAGQPPETGTAAGAATAGQLPEQEANAGPPPEHARARDIVIAGVLCGIAFSTHYYAVFLAVPLALAAWWGGGRGIDSELAQGSELTAQAGGSGPGWAQGSGERLTAQAGGSGPGPAQGSGERLEPGPDSTALRLRTVALALLVMAVTFVVCSPFLVLDPRTAWRDIIANRQIVVDRAGASAGTLFASAAAYGRMVWSEGLGWPVALLAVWGTFIQWHLSKRVTIWFASFPLVFLVFIANTVAAGRYLNPVLPFLAALAALGAHDLSVRLAPKHRAVAAAALVLLAAVPGLVLSRHVGVFFRQDDTRTIATREIEASLEPGSTVLLQPYSVPLRQSREGLIEALTTHLGDPARASTKFQLLLRHLDPWSAPSFRLLYLGQGGLDVDKLYFSYDEFAWPAGRARLRDLGVRLIVLKKYNVEDPATLPLVRTLERGGRLIANISPYRGDVAASVRIGVAPFLHNTDTPVHPALARPGPIIEIWAIP